MDIPSVSALLPIRNGEMHLKQVFENLESTLRPEDEVIIIDDNSIDSTFELIRIWCENFPNRRVLKNPGQGLVDALNFGIANASMEWIARFDADDLYQKSRIEKQLENIHDDSVAIFSDYTFRNAHGKYLGKIPSAVFPKLTELSVLSAQRLPHPVALLRKSAVIAAGGYLSEEFPAEDLGLWIRLMAFGTFSSVPQPLLSYTLSSNSVSAQRKLEMIEMRNQLLKDPVQLHSVLNQIEFSLLGIFRKYFQSSNTWERLMFFYRDLWSASKLNYLTSKQRHQMNLGILLISLNPLTYTVMLKHLYFLRARSKFRRAN